MFGGCQSKGHEICRGVDGGDFKWAFNNAEDDDSYDVDPELKAALKGYKTTLLFVQGEGGYTAVKQQQVSADGKNIHLNPVTGRMSISAYERVKKIEVYNMAGVLVKSIIDKAESKDVDIRNLRNGSYLVRVFTEKGVFNCKLIKSDYK